MDDGEDNLVSAPHPALGTKSETCEEKEAKGTILAQGLVRNQEAGPLLERPGWKRNHMYVDCRFQFAPWIGQV